MTQVGQHIRVLRGTQLRSIYAPTGGLRYDGLYEVSLAAPATKFQSPGPIIRTAGLYSQRIRLIRDRYKIVQYGHKLNEDIEMYRLALVLERVPGQTTMEDLKAVPKPSQLDDWRLHERLEGEKLKSTVGRRNFLAWKTKKMKDKLEHEQWLVSVGLRIGYPHWRGSLEDSIKQKASSMQGRRQAISSS